MWRLLPNVVQAPGNLDVHIQRRKVESHVIQYLVQTFTISVRLLSYLKSSPNDGLSYLSLRGDDLP